MNANRRPLLWLARAALILLGLVLALAVLEAGLQASSWLLRSTTERPEASWSADSVRVLCLGDSNTFGLWIERDQAYPQQLEVLWNQSMSPPTLDAVNFGYPGTSSSMLLRDLDTILDTFMPDIVVMMVGVNDFWTGAVDVTDEPVPFWKRHSRLYRLYLILRAAPKDARIERVLDPEGTMSSHRDRLRIGDREFDVGRAPPSPETLANRSPLKRNLRLLVARAHERGVEVHLMTYPARASFYGPTNKIIRSFAIKSNTPLVDLESVFMEPCPTKRCPKILFEDNHPNAAGYAIVAGAVRDHLASYSTR
jgi:lysophospholipase L1-like esterase